jgi:hypothetical protein
MIVKNTNSDVVIDSLRYQAIAYDSNGNVVEVDSSYISAVFPNEQFGIGSSMFLADDTQLDHIDFQVLAVNFKSTSLTNPLTASDAAYAEGDFTSTVTGTVSSSWDADLENAEVYAIAYDASGAIIGGGYTFLDTVPAGGSTGAEVDIYTSGAPATVELYPTVSSLLDVLDE